EHSLLPPPLWGRGGEGGARELRAGFGSQRFSAGISARSHTRRLERSTRQTRCPKAPPSLSLPHKGGGNPKTTPTSLEGRACEDGAHRSCRGSWANAMRGQPEQPHENHRRRSLQAFRARSAELLYRSRGAAAQSCPAHARPRAI